ncbi:MAG: GldG family protein [Syntrophobacteraceae bacterium]|jgi:ABC-type uncharacterized transport system involved in gliding motility auxiliary subunit|nr:GldG family protein [Syntrophobacteraceae bacterium]
MSAQGKGSRKWAYGSSTIMVTVVFIGIVVFVALISERHFRRVDFSEGGVFSLSEQTRKILDTVSQPVTVKAFFATGAPEEPRARDLLDTFRYYSRHIEVEFIDPDRNPDAAKKYEVRTYGTLVLEGFGKRQSIQTADEQSMANALLKLSRAEQKKIYFLTGHGERSIEDPDREGYSTVRAALQKENHIVEELNLVQQAQVPGDAAVVVVAGPKKKLFDQEIASLEAYLKRGGRLAVFLDPHHDAGLGDFLKRYGVELGENIIIDKLSRVFGGSYLMPVVMEYGFHKISEGFSVMTFFPEARGVSAAKEAPPGARVEVLASTSPNAWAETNFEMLAQGQASQDDHEDLPGPVPVAVISEIDVAAMKGQSEQSEGKPSDSPQGEEKDPSRPEARGHLLVVGDSDFVTNNYFGVSGNGDLFLNMANFLAEEQALITIGSREAGGKPLMLTPSQASLFLWTVMVLVPLLVIMAGLGVYRVRRSQR